MSKSEFRLDPRTIPSFTIRAIEKEDDPGKAAFVQTYKTVFAGQPYFESYTDEDVVNKVWIPHVSHCIVVAESGGIVAGLACCHPVICDVEPSIRDFLLAQTLPFDPTKTVYMSELAVLPQERGHGMGTLLVLERFKWAADAGFESYCMRTVSGDM